MSSAARDHNSAKGEVPQRSAQSRALEPQPQIDRGPGLLPADPDPLAVRSPAQVLALQRTVGNRAVQRLLARQQPPASSTPAPMATLTPEASGEPSLPTEFEITAQSGPSVARIVQRSSPGSIIQRQIGKGQDGQYVIRRSDKKRFAAMDSFGDHEDEDLQYYDLFSVTDDESVEGVADNDPRFDLQALAASSETPKTKPVEEKGVPSKYVELDDFEGPPHNAEGRSRQHLLVLYIDNCLLAGLPEKRVVRAASFTLNKLGGWTAADFDYAILPMFAEQLSDIDGVTEKILDACFTDSPDEEQLGLYASEMQPVHEDEFSLKDEADFVEPVARSFGTDQEGFRKLWRTSPPSQKRLIYSLMSTDPELQSLSEIGYLIEAIDLPKHRYGLGPTFTSWAKGSTERPFFEYLETQKSAERPVAYFNAEEREAFRLEVDTTITTAAGEPLEGDNIFVMSAEKVFYGGAKDKGEINVHHSSFMAGQAVASAGHLFTTGSGRLYKINLASGHYQPTKPHLAKALAALKLRGVDLTKVEAVAGEHGEGVDAETWLSNYLNPKSEKDDESVKY